MEMEIIKIFCLIDDFLKVIRFKDDNQAKMTSSEIMTIAICAGTYFGGNHEKSRNFFHEHHYVKYLLSKSQFNRRLHAIPCEVWENLQMILGNAFKEANTSNEYIVDSFPIAVCDNYRIPRSKIYRGEQYRGFIASKKRYFYGLRAHIISCKMGGPVELILAPGALSDINVFKNFDFELPPGSALYADAIYNDYQHEDLMKEALDINLLPIRKSNSKRPHQPWISFLISLSRKKIETTFSKITNFFPKKIHAITAKGFELKVICFILAHSLTYL
jgi:Transposase DDE domain